MNERTKEVLKAIGRNLLFIGFFVIVFLGLLIFTNSFPNIAISKNQTMQYQSFCSEHNMTYILRSGYPDCYKEDNAIRTYYYILRQDDKLHLELAK